MLCRSIGVTKVTDSSYVGQGWELGLPTDSCRRSEGACYRLFQSAYCGVSTRAALHPLISYAAVGIELCNGMHSVKNAREIAVQAFVVIQGSSSSGTTSVFRWPAPLSNSMPAPELHWERAGDVCACLDRVDMNLRTRCFQNQIPQSRPATKVFSVTTGKCDE